MLASLRIRKAAQALAATNAMSPAWPAAWAELVRVSGNEATALSALQGTF